MAKAGQHTLGEDPSSTWCVVNVIMPKERAVHGLTGPEQVKEIDDGEAFPSAEILTDLKRSLRGVESRAQAVPGPSDGRLVGSHLLGVRVDDESELESASPGQGVDSRDVARSQAPDRKSTRLNSSHHSISYAVFCLK